MTNERLPDQRLLPNHALRSAIDDHLTTRIAEIAATMRGHPTDRKRISDALKEVYQMAKVAENRRRLSEAGVCELVAAVMRNYRTNRNVILRALAAVCHLARFEVS
jgi:hypothetical protein